MKRLKMELMQLRKGKASSLPAAAEPDVEPDAESEAEEDIEVEVSCYNCKGVIPVETSERPTVVKCPHCGLESLLG